MSTAAPRGEYTAENAARFQWGSVSGNLIRERVEYLRKYLIGPRVLDAGCGGGGYVDHLARAGFDAVGVDKHDVFLANAREKAYRGTFVAGDLCERLPFPDGSFDTTYCFDVLEHVDDVAALRELARVTRRRLIVAVPQEDRRADRYLLTYSPYLDMTHQRYYTPESLRELAETVRPARVEVFPECRVPLEMLVCREFRVVNRLPGVGWLYRRVFGFLARRSRGPDWYINLAAVIDLPGNDEP
jgi:SAM-dependent methyltransferase